jgi:amino acid transporter
MSNPSSLRGDDIAARDSTLDSGRVGDESYLRQLGYSQELKRVLGLFGSFAIQFSCIAVSIGLYTLYGYGLTTAGPLVLAPFVVGAFLQMFVGMGIAELISCYPLAGGSYQIASRIGPRNVGWMVGWIVGISLMSATAAEAIAIAPYIASWVGIDKPDQLQTLTIAFGSIILITLINVIGIRLSSLINNVGVLAELLGLTTILVLLLAAGIVQPINFFSNDNGTVAANGGSWIIPFALTLMIPVWIINGFDSPGHTVEETHNAAVTAPRGLVIANWSSLVYGIVAVVILTLSITDLGATVADSAPIVHIVTDRLGNTVASALTVVVIVSFIVNMQILQLTVARMFWAQARDGQFPFARVLRKVSGDNSPANATIFVALVALGLCLWTDAVAVLAAFSALGYAFAYGWTNAVGWWANRRGALPKHPFTFGRWTQPIFAIAAIWSLVFAVIQVWANPNQVGLGAVVAVIIGLLIYYVGVPANRRGVLTQGGVEAIAAESQA